MTSKQQPVFLLGSSESHSHANISQMPDLTTTTAATTGLRAFAEAGIKPADVDMAMIYDSFTITVLIVLEDLGFCLFFAIKNPLVAYCCSLQFWIKGKHPYKLMAYLSYLRTPLTMISAAK